MKKVRFGIIGLGNQGSHYSCDLFAKGAIENGTISALCDINPSKIKWMKEKLGDGNIAYFENYTEMLDSGLVDAVLIETPHYLHPEMAIACLKRGIHVVCEKPAGVYTKQVKEMNRAAEESSALFGRMVNQRTDCLYRKMREIIAEGGIGKIQRVSWIITNWFRTKRYYDSGSWRATWDGEGGGVLINQCPHQLDLVQWVTGLKPCAVRGFCGYGKWHDIEVEDDVTAYFEYENGATGTFVTTTGETPGSNRFEVSGTLGKLLCENDKLMLYKNSVDSLKFSESTDKAFGTPECVITEVETDGKNPKHAGIINNFANAILGLEELFVDGREGIYGVELMNGIELSGWKGGERISLPVDENEYLACLCEKRKTSRRRNVSDDTVLDTKGSFGKK